MVRSDVERLPGLSPCARRRGWLTVVVVVVGSVIFGVSLSAAAARRPEITGATTWWGGWLGGSTDNGTFFLHISSSGVVTGTLEDCGTSAGLVDCDPHVAGSGAQGNPHPVSGHMHGDKVTLVMNPDVQLRSVRRTGIPFSFSTGPPVPITYSGIYSAHCARALQPNYPCISGKYRVAAGAPSLEGPPTGSWFIEELKHPRPG